MRRAADYADQVHRLPRQPDLACHGAADVQQIRHHVRQVAGLAGDDGACVDRIRAVGRCNLQHVDRRRDGPQGIAQLVAQHGEKLVLGMAGRLGCVPRGHFPFRQPRLFFLDLLVFRHVHGHHNHARRPAVGVVAHDEAAR
jgi:hypothetical protein